MDIIQRVYLTLEIMKKDEYKWMHRTYFIFFFFLAVPLVKHRADTGSMTEQKMQFWCNLRWPVPRTKNRCLQPANRTYFGGIKTINP